jgi:hypothetical protein
MWALGIYDFSLTDAQFWRLSLRQYVGLLERHVAERERQEYRAAFIVSAIYNTVRDSKKQTQPYKPEDFMPKKRTKKKEAQSPDQQVDMLTMLALAAEASYGKGGGQKS